MEKYELPTQGYYFNKYNKEKELEFELSNMRAEAIRKIFDSETGLENLMDIVILEIFEQSYFFSKELDGFDYKKYKIFELKNNTFLEEELNYQSQDKIKFKEGITVGNIVEFLINLAKNSHQNFFLYQQLNSKKWHIMIIENWNNTTLGIDFYNVIDQNKLEEAFTNYKCKTIFNNSQMHFRNLFNFQLSPKQIKNQFNLNELISLGNEMIEKLKEKHFYVKLNDLNKDIIEEFEDEDNYGEINIRIKEDLPKDFDIKKIFEFIYNIWDKYDSGLGTSSDFYLFNDSNDRCFHIEIDDCYQIEEQIWEYRKEQEIITKDDIDFLINNWDKL